MNAMRHQLVIADNQLFHQTQVFFGHNSLKADIEKACIEMLEIGIWHVFRPADS
jgi:hypothetical protein